MEVTGLPAVSAADTHRAASVSAVVGHEGHRAGVCCNDREAFPTVRENVDPVVLACAVVATIAESGPELCESYHGKDHLSNNLIPLDRDERWLGGE